jgi:predicted transposase/invertase (TIGR01784 family)
MRRDSIFYQLFRQFPPLLFDLLPPTPANPDRYIFESIEVKETAFRIDGVFIPPDSSGMVYFCEVQFQLDDLLYERLVSKISIYTYRNRERFADWRAVVIYPTRNTEQSRLNMVREFLASDRIMPIYLDELGRREDLSIGLSLMVLNTLEGEQATTEARSLIARSLGNAAIIDLVSTIVVYKFKNLSRTEVDAMLGIELEQTKVYQEAFAEGEARAAARVYQEAFAEGEARGEARGEQALVLRLLNRRVGNISPEIEVKIKSLPLARLEEFYDAALDFSQIGDVNAWFD